MRILLMNCGTFLDIDECAEVTGLCPNGKCRNVPGRYVCECAPGLELENGVCVGKLTVAHSFLHMREHIRQVQYDTVYRLTTLL